MNIPEACQFASKNPPLEWPEDVFTAKILRSVTVESMPTLAEACVMLNHAPSISQARTAIKGGGIRVNGETRRDPAAKLSRADVLHSVDGAGWVVVSLGKHGHAQLWALSGRD
jgi:tyrosyl-tRNA synthetase